MSEATQPPLRQCTKCQQWQPLTEFYIEQERKLTERRGRKFTRACRTCNGRYQELRVAANREYLQAVKIERGCADCGLKSEHAEVYDFDHRPGVVKIDKLSNLRMRTLEMIVAEIEKCDVVCANCHRIRTKMRRDHTRGAYSDVNAVEARRVKVEAAEIVAAMFPTLFDEAS